MNTTEHNAKVLSTDFTGYLVYCVHIGFFSRVRGGRNVHITTTGKATHYCERTVNISARNADEAVDDVLFRLYKACDVRNIAVTESRW